MDYLERGAGILLPISSLPSNYGIGTLGKSAFQFVDELVEAKQMYWQVLPIGPTSFGDSPYQSFSTFAGNPYFIDLDLLIQEGLIKKEEVESIRWFDKEEEVSYRLLWENRFVVLKKAFERFEITDTYNLFLEEQKHWLDDYALYMACKFYFQNQEWLLWEKSIRFREQEAIEKYQKLLETDIAFWKFVQFKFYEQWNALKQYANQKGIKIIGDIPIYVAFDSADVWTNSKLFQLDEELKPICVAGCPPDAFSADGQKWGNPLYDWDAMKEDGFSWWKKRMAASASLYDIIRIDHFIGIVRYYNIPANGSAKDGWFTKGPGEDLLNAINEVLGDAKIIAEDLGVVTDEVRELLKKSGYPGMKVLEFAFDSGSGNPYLPHMYPRNCVVYAGTHDNDTLVGYCNTLPEYSLKYAMDYCDAATKEELVRRIIRLAYASVADVVIIQMQDILEKGNSARMNLPSTIGTNWRWRMCDGEFKESDIMRLANMTTTYNRSRC